LENPERWRYNPEGHRVETLQRGFSVENLEQWRYNRNGKFSMLEEALSWHLPGSTLLNG
jgi:hypothetical protein